MNKKSILAYVLIGLVIIGFFKFNQKSPEDIKREKEYNEYIAKVEQEKKEKELKKQAEMKAQFETLKNDPNSVFHNVYNGIDEPITLSNDQLDITLSTFGGRITSASLKDYKDQKGNNLTLFDSKDKLNANETNKDKPGNNKMGYTFDFAKYGKLSTDNCYFTKQSVSTNEAVLRLDFNENRYIDFTYKLRPGSYMVDLYIKAHNMDTLLSESNEIGVEWKQILRQQEAGYDFEQRYTNISFRFSDGEVDNLSEAENDDAYYNETMSWVAYKNQFFSSILIAGDYFTNTGMVSRTIGKGQNLLKECTTTVGTPFDPSGDHTTGLQFYFGPNKYDILKENSSQTIIPGKELELEELIYFGWPIVRWINRFFIMYLFDFLSGTGLNMGIVLILLTLIVKLCVYPFTKKSFVSSAKMRALKPHINALNEKYPKKEDQLKKQQETMALYQKYGASPMGGCLPMLIQMPIFIALFNFVPNAIELRQESFLWVNDLSAFDSIISWETDIWPIGNHISLFCLLFSVTQIINTYYTNKLQPSMTPEMEQQQKVMRWMMYLMPVIFFFIFNEYSAGLNFYYFLSTLLSIITSIYLRKTIKEDELLKRMEAYAEQNKENVAKRSSMMARLEALQEQQKKMLEERERMRNNRKR